MSEEASLSYATARINYCLTYGEQVALLPTDHFTRQVITRQQPVWQAVRAADFSRKEREERITFFRFGGGQSVRRCFEALKREKLRPLLLVEFAAVVAGGQPRSDRWACLGSFWRTGGHYRLLALRQGTGLLLRPGACLENDVVIPAIDFTGPQRRLPMFVA